MRPAENVVVGEFGGRGALFHGGRQQLFALDGASAFVLARLHEGASPGTAARALAAAAGVDEPRARRFVARGLRQWSRLGVFVRGGAATAGATSDAIEGGAGGDAASGARRPVEGGRTLALCGLRAMLVCADGGIEATLGPVFGHCEVPGDAAADVVIEARATAPGYEVRVNGAGYARCARLVELAPLVKRCLAEIVLGAGGYALALHAAAVERDGRALLLPGASGSGKTSLARALARRGASFMADDTVLVARDGRTVRGLPFAATIKGEVGAPAGDGWHVRADDGRLVRYEAPARRCTAARPAAAIAFPRHAPGAPARLASLDGVGALERLLAGAYAPGGALAAATVGALMSWLREAPCWELEFAEADAGAALVEEALG